jgi:hypothetical protein
VSNSNVLSKVTSKDFWPNVGGKLGWGVVIGRNGSYEAPPVAANRLEQFYRSHIAPFERMYIERMRSLSRQIPANSRNQNGPGAAGIAAQQPLGLPPQQLPFSLSPENLQVLVSNANTSEAELRAKGLSESLIKFIAKYREQLIRLAHQQSQFRDQLKSAQKQRFQPFSPSSTSLAEVVRADMPAPLQQNLHPLVRSAGNMQPIADERGVCECTSHRSAGIRAPRRFTTMLNAIPVTLVFQTSLIMGLVLFCIAFGFCIA